MFFRVQTCGSGEELTLEIDPQQETVLYMKKRIYLRWGVPVQDQSLVCCGHPLEDDMPLATLSRKTQNSETIWLTLCKLAYAENEMFSMRALRSIFSLSAHYEPSDLQDSSQCVPVFLKFCERYSSKMGTHDHEFIFFTQFTWRPKESEQCSLRCVGRLVFTKTALIFQIACAGTSHVRSKML